MKRLIRWKGEPAAILDTDTKEIEVVAELSEVEQAVVLHIALVYYVKPFATDEEAMAVAAQGVMPDEWLEERAHLTDEEVSREIGLPVEFIRFRREVYFKSRFPYFFKL